MHRGIYAVGHRRLTGHGRWMAAVIACGSDALLSHRSAAGLWGLLATAAARVDVTVPGRTRKGHPGLVLHKVRVLHPDDRARKDGIPVTSIARTLLDLAEVARPGQVERAFEEAERLRLLDLSAVSRLCGRSPGRTGLALIGDLLSRYRRPIPETRSELERRFLALCREAGLPEPSVNVKIAGHEVDALWRDRGLVVELDGYAYHGTRAAFERDRLRDADLQLAGLRVLRVSARRLRDEPAAVVEMVRSLRDAS